MANGRNPRRKVDVGRDGGGFVALPWSVLDCPAFQALSHPARSLLLEVARQFVRDNNGRLLASGAYLAARGWKSNDARRRAARVARAASALISSNQPVPTKPPPKNATGTKQQDAGARHRVVNTGGRLAKAIDRLSGSPVQPAQVLPGQLVLFDSEMPGVAVYRNDHGTDGSSRNSLECLRGKQTHRENSTMTP